MTKKGSPVGWSELASGWPWFRGEGAYPLPGYSEVNPPPRLVRKPYGVLHPLGFREDDPFGWPITEYEEALELQGGLRELARELMPLLEGLARGKPGEAVRHLIEDGNPYWPKELLDQKGGFPHERCVLLLPLSLSLTQNDRCQSVWTLFGSSEQGPGRAFWDSFATGPDQGWTDSQVLRFFRRLLAGAFDEPDRSGLDLLEAGLRILPHEPDDGPLPSWTQRMAWSPGESLRGVKYLLTFRPFASLPAPVRKAYREGKLHLLPFPGSLVFWGAVDYRRLARDLPLGMQVPLLMLPEPHRGPNRLRMPQAGWLDEPGPVPRKSRGPVRNTARRPHHPAHFFWKDEDDGLEEHLARVLFSTRPQDLGLYNKPLARNVQIWTSDFRLLLDGPFAGPADLVRAGSEIAGGGRFGYRFQYSPMRVGLHELYWHRPLVAFKAGTSGRTSTLDDAPLGFLTAYPVGKPDPTNPVAILWPRLLRRGTHASAVGLFRPNDGAANLQVLINVRNLLDVHDLHGNGPIPYSLARRLLNLSSGETLESWLEDLPSRASVPELGKLFLESLKSHIETAVESTPVPETLTFARTARRPFELAYWKAMAELSAGRFLIKNNGDCCLDSATQKHLAGKERDLDRVADFLIAHHRREIARAAMQGRAFVASHCFRWQTEWEYPWLGGWAASQNNPDSERNVLVVIPGRDRSRAVIMADHYDTAFMRDHFDRAEGGDGSRLSAPGADDNGSATAALMLAGPVLLELSKRGKLAHDVWLVHLTGEEFPGDGFGARRLCQDLIQGTMRVREEDGKEHDLSGTEVVGAFVLDMIAHRTGGEEGVFQISPGVGRQAMMLAEQAHQANEAWNASVPSWNKKARRKGRFKRSKDPHRPPALAPFPIVVGEVRTPNHPRSTLYNADSQTFSDAGIPVVLLMEDYDISRYGYHDSLDVMANIDLDYGSALAAIAIEAVARTASSPS